MSPITVKELSGGDIKWLARSREAKLWAEQVGSRRKNCSHGHTPELARKLEDLCARDRPANNH